MAGILGNFINTTYRPIFGNVASVDETNAGNNVNVDDLKAQYEKALQDLTNASQRVGSLQSSVKDYYIHGNEIIPKTDWNSLSPGMQNWITRNLDNVRDTPYYETEYANITRKYINTPFESNQIKEAQEAQAAAQKAFDLISAQYNPASGAIGGLTINNSPAIGWGQQAKEMEANSINNAMNMARVAQGAENARVAGMSTHPLLNGYSATR